MGRAQRLGAATATGFVLQGSPKSSHVSGPSFVPLPSSIQIAAQQNAPLPKVAPQVW